MSAVPEDARASAGGRSPRARALALGRLLRLSLAPSALADVAAGLVLGAGGWVAGAGPWLLLLASACIYHGGMVANDWADRGHDARTRPGRPLPSGAVPAPLAALLALGLLLAGPLLALAVDLRAGALAAGVAVLAATYDLAGRGPWRGPLLLALCRAGNLGIGIAYGLHAAGAAPGLAVALAPLVYGAYVLTVSRLGRLEDAEDDRPLGRRPARLLATAAALLLLAALVPVPAAPAAGTAARWLHRLGALGLAALGARGLLARARATAPWTRPDVERAMGLALRRLLVLTATLALLPAAAASVPVAGAILAGYPLSWLLRRAFPPS